MDQVRVFTIGYIQIVSKHANFAILFAIINNLVMDITNFALAHAEQNFLILIKMLMTKMVTAKVNTR
jgi:hypothetical protein